MSEKSMIQMVETGEDSTNYITVKYILTFDVINLTTLYFNTLTTRVILVYILH